jgi:hypothetical protein
MWGILFLSNIFQTKIDNLRLIRKKGTPPLGQNGSQKVKTKKRKYFGLANSSPKNASFSSYFLELSEIFYFIFRRHGFTRE